MDASYSWQLATLCAAAYRAAAAETTSSDAVQLLSSDLEQDAEIKNNTAATDHNLSPVASLYLSVKRSCMCNTCTFFY
jgi:hypothetical protein